MLQRFFRDVIQLNSDDILDLAFFCFSKEKLQEKNSPKHSI